MAPDSGLETTSTLHALLARAARDEAAPELRAFRDRVAATIDRIDEFGLRPGARVAVLLPHGTEQAVWIVAAACAGYIAVPIAPKLKDRQIRHVIVDAEPALLVVDEVRRAGLIDPDATLAMAAACGAHVVGPVGDGEAIDGVNGRGPRCRAEPSDPAVLLYTSGSTGRPKGIVQSHRSLADGARIVAGYLGLRPSDRILGVLSLSFDYGLNQVLSALHAGCAFELRDFFAAGDLIANVERSRATVLAGVPPLWITLAALLDKQPAEATRLRSLRLITNSGGRLPEPVLRVLREHLPHAAIWSMYGLSEAFRSSALDPAELDARPRSIGRAIPEVELLVLDRDGRPCAPGQVGELVHCGALVADGYWRKPEDTARVFRPDPRPGAPAGAMAVWSGDLVRVDADGYLEFVTRRDQQLKIRGWRISTEEVLDVVRDVAGVDVAVAFGHTPDGADEPELVVVVAGDADPELATRVRSACRRELPAPMVPARVEIVDGIPRTAHGKFDVPKLRRRLAIGA